MWAIAGVHGRGFVTQARAYGAGRSDDPGNGWVEDESDGRAIYSRRFDAGRDVGAAEALGAQEGPPSYTEITRAISGKALKPLKGL